MAGYRRPLGFDRRLVTLPLIALLTASAVLVPAELIVRARYPDQELDRCDNVALTPPHGRPNCSATVKVPEGPWVVHRYNECGYRSPAPCGPVPRGTLRVAVVGSSMGAGTFVPEPQTIPGRLPRLLAAGCGRPVQGQNLALPDFPVDQLAVTAGEAAGLKPDVLLLVMTSFDVNKSPAAEAAAKQSNVKLLIQKIQASLKDFSLVYMAKVMYLSNEQTYLDFIAEQRRTDDILTLLSKGGLATFAAQVSRIRHLHRNIPMVIAFAPSREEVARRRLRPDHEEPAPAAMRTVAREQGAVFINGLDAVPADQPSGSLYYIANGHMNGKGDAYLAAGVARAIKTTVPRFSNCVSAN